MGPADRPIKWHCFCSGNSPVPHHRIQVKQDRSTMVQSDAKKNHWLKCKQATNPYRFMEWIRCQLITSSTCYALRHMHIAICTSPHALTHMHIAICTSPHALNRMHSSTITLVKHWQSNCRLLMDGGGGHHALCC